MIDRYQNPEDKNFDILFTALGYEQRCIFIPQKFENKYKQGVCFQFQDRQQFSYLSNLEFYKNAGFDFIPWTGICNRDQLIELLMPIDTEDQEARIIQVAIDISAMNRQMVANIIYTLAHTSFKHDFEVSVLYAPAQYTDPVDEMPIMKIAGPVIPEYAGWYINPSDPLYAIIGLGYENGKALGILEFLDVANAWLFKPLGSDESFINKVDAVNHDLISSLGQSKVINYKLSDPYDTFIKLQSLIEGLQKNNRIILIPFGPKLFNVICLILAEIYFDQIAVWRVSAGDQEQPKDHKADETIISFVFRITQN